MTWEEQENYHVKADELDVAGDMFGMRLVDVCAPNGLVEIYIEDDETYFRKVTVNRVWLDDLIRVANAMKELIE